MVYSRPCEKQAKFQSTLHIVRVNHLEMPTQMQMSLQGHTIFQTFVARKKTPERTDIDFPTSHFKQSLELELELESGCNKISTPLLQARQGQALQGSEFLVVDQSNHSPLQHEQHKIPAASRLSNDARAPVWHQGAVGQLLAPQVPLPLQQQQRISVRTRRYHIHKLAHLHSSGH
jgi:hypothetical protein